MPGTKQRSSVKSVNGSNPPSPLPRDRMSRLLFLLFLVTAVPVRAQLPDSLSQRTRISLLTILPGDAVYSSFGHSALRVSDPGTGFDAVFNYGTFDFEDPLFLPKFVYGKLDYFLSVAPFRYTIRASEIERRPIIEQVLNLSPAQAEAVYQFLRVNALPENRYYRYDFLFDNCSTRPRDVLEKALGQALRFAPEPDPKKSFRELLDPYVADRPWLDFGFDLVLGASTDRIASPHEVMFLPDYLMEAFDHASLIREGRSHDLVLRKDTLLWIPDYVRAQSAFPWPFALFSALFLFALTRTILVRRRGEVPSESARTDRVLFALSGLAGLFLLFMWLGTEHHVTKWNWNVLWLLPTHVAAVYALWRNLRIRWLRTYFMASATLAVFTFAGFFFAWPQAFHPAAAPLMLLLALRAGWVARTLQPKRENV